jgi:hypothetical protein
LNAIRQSGWLPGVGLIQKIEIGKPFFVTFRYNYGGTKNELQGLICLPERRFSARGRNATRVQVERVQIEKETQVRSAQAIGCGTISLILQQSVISGEGQAVLRARLAGREETLMFFCRGWCLRP